MNLVVHILVKKTIEGYVNWFLNYNRDNFWNGRSGGGLNFQSYDWKKTYPSYLTYNNLIIAG